MYFISTLLIFVLCSELITVVKTNSLKYFVNTTVINYKTIQESCSSCCKTKNECKIVGCSKGSVGCHEECKDVCVQKCNFICYTIYTINKYHLISTKTSLKIQSNQQVQQNQNLTDVCSYKTFDKISDLNKYLEITKQKYPIGYNTNLYLNYNSGLCYKNNTLANKTTVQIITMVLVGINIICLVFL